MYLLFIIIVLFFIIGVTYSIRGLVLWFLNSNSNIYSENLVYMLSSYKEQDITIELNLLISRLKWMNYKNITFVDNGLDDEDYKISVDILKEAGFILYSKDEYIKRI